MESVLSEVVAVEDLLVSAPFSLVPRGPAPPPGGLPSLVGG